MTTKHVLFVHGIGEQPENYSLPYWNDLWAGVSPVPATRWELRYSDVFDKVEAKATLSRLRANQPLKDVIKAIIHDESTAGSISDEIDRDLHESVFHVLCFLTDPAVQGWIHTLFTLKLNDLLRAAAGAKSYPPDVHITIASHSLGTVVAYMGLHKIAADDTLGFPARVIVRNLYSLASPLKLVAEIAGRLGALLPEIPYVTHGISRPRYAGTGRTPGGTTLRQWHVFRHEKDPVASLVPLSPLPLGAVGDSEAEFNEQLGTSIHGFDNYLKKAGQHLRERI
jgi:hypothetical protein